MDLERLKLAKTVKPKKSRDKVKSGFTFYQFAKRSLVNKKSEETLFNLLRRSLLFLVLYSYYGSMSIIRYKNYIDILY